MHENGKEKNDSVVDEKDNKKILLEINLDKLEKLDKLFKKFENDKLVKDKKAFHKFLKFEKVEENILKEASKKRISEIESRNNKKINENFELLEEIGRGVESQVFKAKLKKSKKEFAIKIIKYKNEQKRNFSEFHILNKLKNKNVIEFFSIINNKDDKSDIIIMGLGDHGNIIDFKNKLIKQIYFSETLLCFFAYQILNALNYLHNNNITHLDLKPQNIVIDKYLYAKLIDFSISLNYGKIKSKEIKIPLCGTNFFIAPEIILSKTIKIKDLNKCDLYSFGIILYYLAFGYFPFDLNIEDAKNPDKIKEKINTKNLVINNDYSPYFTDFIKKLLEKDIDKRINIKEALNDYWIKGANILFDEKEKLYNASNFLGYLVTDHIKSFNDYIKKK